MNIAPLFWSEVGLHRSSAGKGRRRQSTAALVGAFHVGVPFLSGGDCKDGAVNGGEMLKAMGQRGGPLVAQPLCSLPEAKPELVLQNDPSCEDDKRERGNEGGDDDGDDNGHSEVGALARDPRGRWPRGGAVFRMGGPCGYCGEGRGGREDGRRGGPGRGWEGHGGGEGG